MFLQIPAEFKREAEAASLNYGICQKLGELVIELSNGKVWLEKKKKKNNN